MSPETPSRKTELLSADDAGIARAAELLRQAELVAMPTETVYGLAGDASSDTAVAGIYAAKGRPSFNPLIAHVADLDAAEALVDIPAAARVLAQAFWPGPMTLVMPLKPGAKVSPLVTAGLPTLAIRIPGHPVARRLLKAFGGALAAPSANPSGRISPTEPNHVLAGLSGRIAAVLDGGACGVGVESTILAVAADGTLRLLRPGGLSAEEVQEKTGLPVLANTATGIEAPGQMTSHYAPKGTMRLNADTVAPDEVLLGFGPVRTDWNLSPAGNLPEAAANLFRMMHGLDRAGVAKIAVSPIPETGIGLAINDRLRRAAAPRD
ncbi:threonylcarbamoyl-AMP synthase [Pseudooceanicola sp. CBS1P-1]|uniref:Threonylcarbamoyl-AMP synthase n=1 Tax=Pseudooceanicola albus TaxID=2692189 RepID=A0A6L7G662_9RHOB|nr:MULTISPECIES: L-threonylcarbamoyladenylate synthase [Pseudooceanicola]MBT9384853.1 threonylcarbamoyl-AMP synthase [Pseudooceanicola endophyticus]MXN18153.1 threonylcarbamoyl-AMP synthase [Pseudooceanicola albus]